LSYPEKEFLSYLKREPDNLFLIVDQLLPNSYLEEVDFLREEAIKIIEAGVFYQGGLKGASHGAGINFDKIPISSSMSNLILELAFDVKLISYAGNWQNNLFADFKEGGERIIEFLKQNSAKRILAKFEKTYNDLISLESDIKQLNLSEQKRMKYLRGIIANTLLKNVVRQRGVKAVIAERTQDILSAFDMQCNPHTVRKYLENK
jgi:hypothetical protein